MKRQTLSQGNSKVIVYAILIVVILGFGFVAMQDIKSPANHVEQQIEVKLEK